MMEELIAFSQFEKFKIIFLRNIPEFYNKDLEVLKKNGIEMQIKPFVKSINLKEFFYVFFFLLKNLNKLIGKQNLIWTLNSMYWFWRLDKNQLKNIGSIHAQFASQAAIVSYFIKQNYGIEYYFTFHAHDIYFKNRWFTDLVNNAALSFSISEFNIRYVQKHYPNLNSKKIKLSRLGVYLPENTEIKDFPEKEINIGFISNLEEKKGIPFLMEAFLKLYQSKTEKYKLMIAGAGDYMQYIRKFIEQHKLEQAVSILGKVRDQKKIDFYRDTDIFVLPSIRTKNDMDGIPVVLMEAIAYGIPLISTDISGIPEICRNNYNGFLIEEKNTSQIVAVVEKILNSKDVYLKFSENSLQLAKEEYDLVKNSVEKMKIMSWHKY